MLIANSMKLPIQKPPPTPYSLLFKSPVHSSPAVDHIALYHIYHKLYQIFWFRVKLDNSIVFEVYLTYFDYNPSNIKHSYT